MSLQVKHRRGTTAEIEAFTPAVGEFIMDTQTKSLVLGDGTKQGGHRQVTRADIVNNLSTLPIAKAQDLEIGDLITTSGYVTLGDGGGATYRVVAAREVDGFADHLMDNGLVLELHLDGYIVNIRKFGANETTDASPSIQAAINYTLVLGGELYSPRGAYPVEDEVVVDVRGITGAPNSNQRRLSLRGAGKGNTVWLAKTDSQTILHFIGDNPTTTASHAYTEFADISFGGATPTSRTAEGLRLEDLAYFTLRNVSFHNLNACLNNIACLSSTFYTCDFNESVKGIVAQQATGASDPNANSYYGCNFRLLTKMAYDGFGGMANGLFSGCNFEGNGTFGDDTTGAVNLRIDASAGEVGPVFESCYFESNRGGFDLQVASTGGRRITANLTGVNFNRVSGASYTTNNIRTSGKLNLNTVGCAFTPYNDYVPNISRLCILPNNSCRHVDVGSTFYSSVDIPTNLASTVFAGDVTGEDAGAFGASSYILPAGWSATRTAAGHYTVIHNLGHTNYSITATSNGTFQRSVERCIKAANSFQIRTVAGGTLTLADCNTTFTLSAFQPSIS